MTVVGDLIAAIEADPADDAPQLVIADLLQAEGDPRGDLIVLDHRERAGDLHDPAALEQLLLLAAEYSFPRAVLDEPMLPFVRHGEYPLVYTIDHVAVKYTITYASGRLTIEEGVPWDREHLHHLELADEWTAEETRVMLTILGDAIRARTPLDRLYFPYEPYPLPTYDGGPLRCYGLPPEFLTPRALPLERYGLAARDYHRWHAIWHRLRRMTSRGAATALPSHAPDATDPATAR